MDNAHSQQAHQEHGRMMKMGWGMFAAMVATSTIVMFFLMYQAVYRFDHATFSQTRMWMAFVMGAVMGIIMLGFMWSMFMATQRMKMAVAAALLAMFAIALWLVRSQQTVGDVSFMKSMIPHHSIAISNARKAQITDPRVQKLADEIISSQVREIAEMKLLVADIEKNGSRGKTVLPRIPAKVTPDMQPKIEEAVQ